MKPKWITVPLIVILFITGTLFTVNPEPVQSQTESPDSTALKRTVLWLGGNTEYADVPYTTSFDLGIGQNDDFTIECFFYVPTVNDDTAGILITHPSQFQLYIVFHNTMKDYINFHVFPTPATNIPLYYGSDISTGWHHLAAIWDNEHTATWDYRAIYLDGNLVASAENFEVTPGLWKSTSPIYIGFDSSNTYDGYLEEIRISSSVRYGSTTYTVPSGAFADDAFTRALWHFNEIPGSTNFMDSSGNGNHLTGYHGATTVNFFENPIFIPIATRH